VAKDRRLLTRVVLRNYKSIAACDVRPAQLSFLVGPNGSGKSNFLDALRFVADSIRFSLDHALRDRGGINEVRRRSGGHPTHFAIRLEFNLASASGNYTFAVGAKKSGGFEVQHEECRIARLGPPSGLSYYEVDGGSVARATFSPAPAAASDRLYLVNVSGLAEFRPLYDALAGMGFYNLNPDLIRDLQPPDPGDLLKRDGSNITSVLSRISTQSPDRKRRIEEYLAKVVPGIVGVERRAVGPRETLEFRQTVRGAKYPWQFLAGNMSDGTLRAFGVLVAIFHAAANGDAPPRLVGIEEPEVALHPAAAGVLTDALRDASEHAQILVTSHSPDLLDDEAIPNESILAVMAEDGETHIGPLDEAGRSALSDHLYTAGELLRLDQLRPDPRATTLRPDQLELYGPASEP
jgi:predicted ATPase